MERKQKWSSVLLTIALVTLVLSIGPVLAQTKVETDARFEKLAKELYP